MTKSMILEKINTIEKDLQQLKIDFLLGSLNKQRGAGVYKDDNILKEIKKIRKQLWNEKYSKTI